MGMKGKSYHHLSTVLPAILLLLLAASCNRTRNNPGYDYFPDMYYSQAYETYAPNPNFSNGSTMRTPPPGSVPMDMVPFDYEKTEEDLLRAGRELVNPIPAGEAVRTAGKRVYGIFCINCHGENGDGQGFLYTSGKYLYPPANLLQQKTKDRPDGEIYHIITVGYGIMGAHGAMISQADRWKVIHYLREELQANAQ